MKKTNKRCIFKILSPALVEQLADDPDKLVLEVKQKK